MKQELRHTTIFEGAKCGVVLAFKLIKADSLNCGLAFVFSIALWLDTQGAIAQLKFPTCSTGNTASTNNKLARSLNNRMRD